MYGLRFPDGEVDYITTDLGELRSDWNACKCYARQGQDIYAGAEPSTCRTSWSASSEV